MPEKIQPLPLSGEEVRLAILDKISQSLQKDCFLSSNVSYDYFSCKVAISLKCHDVGRVAEVEQVVVVEEGVDEGENPDELIEVANAEFEMQPAAPNEVRVDTGQDVPVLTKDADGKPKVEKIRYARHRAKKSA